MYGYRPKMGSFGGELLSKYFTEVKFFEVPRDYDYRDVKNYLSSGGFVSLDRGGGKNYMEAEEALREVDALTQGGGMVVDTTLHAKGTCLPGDPTYKATLEVRGPEAVDSEEIVIEGIPLSSVLDNL